MITRICVAALFLATTLRAAAPGAEGQPAPAANRPLRAGMIGLDTSHVIAFAKEFNDAKETGELAGVRDRRRLPGRN